MCVYIWTYVCVCSYMVHIMPKRKKTVRECLVTYEFLLKAWHDAANMAFLCAGPLRLPRTSSSSACWKGQCPQVIFQT